MRIKVGLQDVVQYTTVPRLIISGLFFFLFLLTHLYCTR